MVKILQDNTPLSTAQRFAQAFQSAGAALPQALHTYEKDKERAELKIAKRKAKMPAAIKTHLSLYDQNKFFLSNPEKMAQLDDLSTKYSEKGFEPNEAVKQAYEDITNGRSDKSGTMGTSGTNDYGTTGERLKGDEKKWSLPFKAQGPLHDFVKLFKKDVENQNREEGQELTGLQHFLKNRFGLQMKVARAVINAIDFPFQLAKEGPLGFGNKISPRGYHGGKFDTLTDMFDKATGNTGVPESPAERIASGAVLGVPGVIAAGSQEALSAAGAPRWVQEAGGILSFLFTHKAKLPSAESLLKQTKLKSQRTGKPPETVLKEAMKETGITEEQVAQGDESAIRTLKDKVAGNKEKLPRGFSSRHAFETSEKVKMTPKTVFNKKAAIKQREAFGAKLSESPLEAHYDIEAKNAAKEAGKGESVRAREAEIRERLAPEEKKLFEDIRQKQEQLTRIERERQSAVDPEAKARLNTHYDYQVKAIQEATDKLKDVQYQMKYGRARPTEAEIDSQIKKSIESYEDAIKNPTEKTSKDVRRQLELDKQYLDRAQKILDRGELPGEVRPDTFIKMKDKYLKAYKTAIKEARDTIQSLKGEKDVDSIRTMRQKQDLIDTLSNRVKRLEADIINQTDKLKSLGALNKPSGAFYKNQLKSLKKDQALFKHDLFENKMVKNPVRGHEQNLLSKRPEGYFER